ncbi:MAG: lysophospholipase [Gemmatales bacterium]|nr:MAG: lysophospholipase [Gemmatales bacterium]
MDEGVYTIREHRASDGYCWRYRSYRPEGKARAHVVCLHGIQSHAGWYGSSCEQMREAGFAVSFIDRRGSGMNQQDRGDAPSFRRLLDDIAEFLSSASVEWGERLPVHLLGISWGGKIAVAFQRRHPGLCHGLVLLAPGICAKVRPPLSQRCRILAARLWSPKKAFPIPLNDPALFTAQPRWQQFIRNDPLSLHEASARFLIESFRLDVYLRFVPRHVHVPVLLLLAEHDRIVDNRRTRRYFERFASREKRIMEYPGAHHTLEFEPQRERIVGDIIDWLKQHTS